MIVMMMAVVNNSVLSAYITLMVYAGDGVYIYIIINTGIYKTIVGS